MVQFHWTTVVSDLMTLNECVQAGAAIVLRTREWFGGDLARGWMERAGAMACQSACPRARRRYVCWDVVRTNLTRCSRRGSDNSVGCALRAEGL
jgi:hypothetical protein